ncbi:hypothetical protein VTO73DRAFT_8259 [Trametes versicolor]
MRYNRIRKSPLHILADSFIPAGSTDYTTVVILHGYAYHSGIFAKLLPLAPAYNARVMLVNRRDYPGSAPFTEAERALLPSQPLDCDDLAAAREKLQTFMKAQARELYDFLEILVEGGDVPPADRKDNTGGIVVAGWSMGAAWMTAFLAHAPSFYMGGLNLAHYIQRVVFLDPPFRLLGYPNPDEKLYNPLFDTELLPEEREDVFAKWVSGYFEHGDTVETLALKTPLPEPPSTLLTLTAEDVERVLCLPPGAPGGSEALLLHGGIAVRLWKDLREAALALPDNAKGVGNGDAWREVEVCNVTCEQSVCDCLFARMCLREEVETAKAKGSPTRGVRFVLIKGANHFVQWDRPELVLRALVGDEDVVE